MAKDKNITPEETEEQVNPAEETSEEKEETVVEETPDTEDAEAADDSEKNVSEGEDEKGTKKKGPFRKEKKDPRDEKIEQLSDQVLRQMAEFENFRKRTDKEKEASFANGAKSVVEKLLPIIDNFERAVGARTEDTDAGYADGVEMIYKQFNTVLEQMGVKPIEAVGQEFDPNLHNAVMHVDDDQYGENEVVEELQKGYLYGETVLRHSMVKVAN